MSTKGTHIPDWLAVPFAGITPAPSQQKGQDLFPTGNWRAIRPVYRDKMPPCNNACGTNEKIQGYLDLVKRGARIGDAELDHDADSNRELVRSEDLLSLDGEIALANIDKHALDPRTPPE